MRKTFKKLTALALVLIIVLSFASCTSPISTGPQYRVNENTAALYRYKSATTEREFTVADTYEDKPVTELMAFSLANAEYLEVLNIGKNIEVIDVWALTNCPLLKAIHVDAENPYFTSVDGVLYNKDMTELLAYPNGKTPIETDDSGAVVGGGTIVLPETVKSIRENAFYLCSNLYSVTFNEGLEVIGNKAFLKCANLQNVKFPNTLTEIGTDAFSYCNSFTALEIPSSVQKINDYAFFSTASKIEKIVVHKDSENDLELGEDWIPSKESSIRDKVPVEYVGAE
ncbi:MAG: leucine-rich repeat domain-containing protein [Candidatus Fimenecus sp.]